MYSPSIFEATYVLCVLITSTVVQRGLFSYRQRYLSPQYRLFTTTLSTSTKTIFLVRDTLRNTLRKMLRETLTRTALSVLENGKLAN